MRCRLTSTLSTTRFAEKSKCADVVTAELGAENVRVAWDVAERRAEQALAQAATVERRRVNEVHTEVERDAHGADRLVEVDRPELRAERRRAEAQPGQFQAGLAECSEFHVGGIRVRSSSSPGLCRPRARMGSPAGSTLTSSPETLGRAWRFPFPTRRDRRWRCRRLSLEN